MTNAITLPRSVVERALEALTNCTSEYGHRCNRCDSEVDPEAKVASALRAALEQSQGEQEPVAYYVMNGAALFQLFRSKSQADALAYDLQKRHDVSGSPAHFHVVPLYTHPQPKRQPLTNEQVKAGLIDSIDFADQRERCAFNIGVRFAERAHGIGGEE